MLRDVGVRLKLHYQHGINLLTNTTQNSRINHNRAPAYPTMVPTPTSVSTATPATLVKSSGADEPAAMNVAPATSSDSCSFSEISSSDGTKKSSQTIARAVNRQRRGVPGVRRS